MSEQIRRFPSLSHWGAYTAVTQGGRLIDCEPFAHDSAPSSILQSMPAMVHSPLRVNRPAIRKGWLRDRHLCDGSERGRDDYVEVSWDDALAAIHSELQRVRTEHGSEAIFGGSYGWSSAGRLHHARTQTHRFLNAGGGFTNQAGNYSWGTAQFLLPHVIGTYTPVTGRVTDWNSVTNHTRLLIAFGGMPLRNTQITSGGAGDHPVPGQLERAVAAGIEFVVISPTRGDVPPGVRARWIPIRPNTDAALMLAMIQALIADGIHDEEFLQIHCVGFPTLREYLEGKTDGTPKTPEWAEAICDVPADTIRALARQARNTRTMLTCAWSLQRAHRGEQPYWASIALAAALGHIGLPGGGFAFGHASMNGAGNPRMEIAGPAMESGRNPTGSVIPVARVTDMLLHPGQRYEFNGRVGTYPDIKMVYWAGGNPFHHQQDLNRLSRAWSRPQTIVAHEIWWTPMARRSDIVLPATTTLERNDIGGSTRDRHVFAMHQALAPIGSSRNDFDIYRELAALGGYEHGFTEGRGEMEWVRQIYESMAKEWRGSGYMAPDFDAFWSRGFVEIPEPEKPFVLFEEFRRDPAGNPLRTPSGRIELYSEKIAGFGYADCPPHPSWLAPDEWLGSPKAARWPLHLLTPQPAGKLHSQMDGGKTSVDLKVNGREALRIAPSDAQARRIGQHDLVKVYNDRGACLATAVIDADLKPGVVALPTGAWFDAADENLEIHGNPNVLTIDVGTSRLTQGSSAQSALVEVMRWEEAAPLVQALEVPAIVKLDRAA
ncbi:molybdopterin-dependent oxidoreductase [Achromobacter pestifer]|uniref:Molybdopterin-dependent oxidoreductase n=1 Tax=Achromobacter pestifer TaxID=1353889 RepID=A0A7D4DY64_9BURK|nr:molybdopterin-dependent oxidoreductase [Achromobacter pestifer]QKH36452.1 molybdopterin-dependent oxidoreductase [Achromobacter pestifer]